MNIFMKENLFDPLGMRSTAFRITPDMRTRLAGTHLRGADGNTDTFTFASGGVIAGTGRRLGHERHGYLGDVNRHRQSHSQPHQGAQNKAQKGSTALLVHTLLVLCGLVALAHILAGALTPSICNPLCNTCRVAATSASRASRTSSSSTRMRSAS